MLAIQCRRSGEALSQQLTLLSLFSLQILDDSNNIRVSDGQMRGLELLLEFSKRALGRCVHTMKIIHI